MPSRRPGFARVSPSALLNSPRSDRSSSRCFPAVVLVLQGPGTSPAIGYSYFALASRLDLVSLVMLLLVSFIGWVVLRYAGTFLDGEERQGPFTGWMTATLAAVLFLVQSGTLLQLVIGWVATSILLHQLLLFYPERIAAQRAAARNSSFRASVTPRWSAPSSCSPFPSAPATSPPSLPRPRGRRSAADHRCRRPPCCRRTSEVRSVPDAWMADGSDGNADPGFGPPACRCRQCRRLPPDPLCRCHAAGAGGACGAGHGRRLHGALRQSRDAHTVGGEDLARLVDGRADGLHDPAMWPGTLPDRAAAHRRPFALQGACLPRLRLGDRECCFDQAARSGRDPECQGGRTRLPAGADHLRRHRSALRLCRQAAAGARARCDPDLRRRLSDRARLADAAPGRSPGGPRSTRSRRPRPTSPCSGSPTS